MKKKILEKRRQISNPQSTAASKRKLSTGG